MSDCGSAKLTSVQSHSPHRLQCVFWIFENWQRKRQISPLPSLDTCACPGKHPRMQRRKASYQTTHAEEKEESLMPNTPDGFSRRTHDGSSSSGMGAGVILRMVSPGGHMTAHHHLGWAPEWRPSPRGALMGREVCVASSRSNGVIKKQWRHQEAMASSRSNGVIK